MPESNRDNTKENTKRIDDFEERKKEANKEKLLTASEEPINGTKAFLAEGPTVPKELIKLADLNYKDKDK